MVHPARGVVAENAGEIRVEHKDKSLTNLVPTKEDPSWAATFGRAQKEGLVAISSCPNCGAPIYGKATVLEGATSEDAKVVYSCECRNKK